MSQQICSREPGEASRRSKCIAGRPISSQWRGRACGICIPWYDLRVYSCFAYLAALPQESVLIPLYLLTAHWDQAVQVCKFASTPRYSLESSIYTSHCMPEEVCSHRHETTL